MKSFLGSCVLFQQYVDHYNILAAPLYDTTKVEFDWSKPNCHFQNLKVACANCVDLFAPAWSCPFIVRADASVIGIGAVLLQLLPPDHPIHPNQLVPIAFCSHKFSACAQRWSTYDQETFSIFYSVT